MATMERFAVFALVMFLVFCIQGLSQAQQCKRTNPKPWRYCVDNECTSDKNCGKNEKCLCDGDCGLSCIKKGLRCETLRKPRNGIAKYAGAPGFQQTVTYSCKNGYTLRGSKKRTCRGIGKWDGRNTRCPMRCKHPGDITYGNNDGERKLFKVGAKVNYWCFPGYELQGNRQITCTKDGSWSSSLPKCILPTCPKPVTPKNARSFKRLKGKYKYNQMVSFVCEHGYFTAGSRIQRCLQGGKWSGSRLRCLPKSCSNPGTPKNGRRRGYVFTFKNKVYYECNRGYIRLGPEFRQCQSNQRWSGDTPTCEPIDCRSLPTPLNGEMVEETKTTYQGRVTFQCKKKGYELQGSSTRVCQEDGKWDGTLTTCAPVKCKDPGKPVNGGRNPDIDEYVYENKVMFACKNNYTLQGNKFIICEHDKTWTGTPPKCLAPCRDPGIPKGGSRHHHSFLHGNKVRFSCKHRWTMDGEREITCTDGTWDEDTPKCLDCDQPLGMEDGRIPDANIRASTYTRRWYHYPRYARLNGLNAWCAPFKKSFLEVDLGKTYRIMYVATQGSAPDKKWVKHYIISHTLVRSSFIEYREKHKEKMFLGNNDATTIVKHRLNHPFIARKVRFIPYDPSRDQKLACMRVEIYGCDLPTDCVLVGSRVLGRWFSAYKNIVYYKAYVKTIDGNYAQLELENDAHHDTTFKKLPKTSIVLDVPPKQDVLRKGTTVLAPEDERYYLGKILRRHLNKYIVRLPDQTISDWIPINELRLQEPIKVCD